MCPEVDLFGFEGSFQKVVEFDQPAEVVAQISGDHGRFEIIQAGQVALTASAMLRRLKTEVR